MRKALSGAVEHLEELRKRIIIVLAFFLVALVVSLVFASQMYHFLIRPAHGLELAVLGPGDVVRIFLVIAGLAALVATIPVAAWQVAAFVGPGLLPKERAYVRKLTLPVSVMFLAGVCFGYFLVFPEIFHFLYVLSVHNFRVLFTASEYFSFMMDIVIPFGLIFELPVVVLFLTSIGIITPKLLRKVRRYAYFVCIVLGTLISPPELISHLSVTVPMILIYEVSIGISALAYRRKLAAESWWREDTAEDAPVQETDAMTIGVRDEDVMESAVTEQADAATDLVVVAPQEPVVPAVTTGEERSEATLPVLPPKDAVADRLAMHMGSRSILPRRTGIQVEERE